MEVIKEIKGYLKCNSSAYIYICQEINISKKTGKHDLENRNCDFLIYIYKRPTPERS